VGLDELDRGKVRWNEPLPLTKDVMGEGAGWMANKPLGTRFPFFEAATEMIRVSDNSATNLLIKRLGGIETMNQRFRALGLPATVLRNWLPDLKGTNSTSARDLARTIALVDTGEKLSPRARDLYREILSKSNTNTLIPMGLLKGLGKGQTSTNPDDDLLAAGITTYNKTGDIGIAYSDAALIQLPNGQRAVAAFLVKGPFNDPRSAELIRAMAATLDRAIEVEDVSMALVQFANGAQASVVNSALSPRQETYIRLDYQRATVELTHLYSYNRDNWRFTPAVAAEGEALTKAWQQFPADVGSTHAAQLEALVSDMDANRRPLLSGPEARRTLEFLTALYKSAFTGRPVARGSIVPGDPYSGSLHGDGSPRRAVHR
jgi:hypothetical protein